ncbi:hypothetical protein [Streptomyces cavernae]|uniref:hypothetical protein n=1 Tax=Streptomyces cavernae TaxID=2259034 RepID=UPI000FEBCA00|nr:hypothetical protein [Streptomyces cavernae]
MRKTQGLHRFFARLAVALTAGAALAMTGPGAAHADSIVEIPAPTEGGVSVTVDFHDAVVPQPYTPDQHAPYWEPTSCQLYFRDFRGSYGCGGFRLGITLNNVRNQPGYLAGLNGAGEFAAHADTSRTFGCQRPDGSFDESTSFVVNETQRRLSWVYPEGSVSQMIYSSRQNPAQKLTRNWYVNFWDIVEVNCPEGMTPTQTRLEISNLNISIEDPQIFGTTTWNHAGPIT